MKKTNATWPQSGLDEVTANAMRLAQHRIGDRSTVGALMYVIHDWCLNH